MPRSYKKESITETGWSDWLSPSDLQDYKIACCDCGLVHTFQLRPIVKVVEGKTFTMHELVSDGLEEGQTVSVAIRAKRDNRATGQLRRRKRQNGERLNYE
jgi:hypothetical protein